MPSSPMGRTPIARILILWSSRDETAGSPGLDAITYMLSDSRDASTVDRLSHRRGARDSATSCHASRFQTRSSATGDLRGTCDPVDYASKVRACSVVLRTVLRSPDVSAGARQRRGYCQPWRPYQASICLRVSSLAIPYRS